MSQSPPPPPSENDPSNTARVSEESQLMNLLERWEAAYLKGVALSPEQLCEKAPELLDQLRWKIAAMQTHPGMTDTPLAEAKPARPVDGSRATELPAEVRAENEFEALRFLAQGGLGAVYVGQDRSLHRDVAVKFLHPRLAHEDSARQRFQLEAEITARLEHPGVVPLHALGELEDGRQFYVMRLIQGETLDAAIERLHKGGGDAAHQSLEFRDLLGRFVDACQTIAYAHNRGVLHRDIKPQNVMLGRYGETLVVDWGLALPIGRGEQARASGERTLVPASISGSDTSGSGAGTPAYMSPEQASGTLELTCASDVFSLGATLYKLLTGRPPFEGRSAVEVISNARAARFDAPRMANSRVPRNLESVCLRAMAADPAQRYATPLELARDIERWLADEPVTAARENVVQRWSRWCRRHRGTVRTLASLGLAATLAALFAAVAFRRMAGDEFAARVAAEQAREQGLQAAAKFAARTVAGEVDLRWRILETEAADSELRTLLEQINASDDGAEVRARLQGWLDARFIEHAAAAKAASWFVTDRRGMQQARSPIADTVGRSFAFRDYFHGLGRELSADEAAGVEPIRSVYRSSVYDSQASHHLMVAFSVPVWSGKVGMPGRQVIGVLAMTVELGQFSVLQSDLGTDQMAVLVDTRTDWVGGTAAGERGLVLHHPVLEDQPGDGPDDTVSRIDPELLQDLIRLRGARLSGRNGSGGAAIRTDYRDPLDRSGDAWLAAFEPVLVQGRPDELRDTGWVVIVQTRQMDTADVRAASR
ncbi:MAG: protein kinase [Planctomyces sp.]|nr:protein kinase [Planctomyces sp.]